MLKQSVLSVLLMLVLGSVTAGSQHPSTARQVQCERTAMGAMFRAEGHAAKVVWWSREQMGVGDEPKDAIHIRDDGETPEQKAQWELYLLQGWTIQDDWMAEHNDVARDARLIFATCMLSQES